MPPRTPTKTPITGAATPLPHVPPPHHRSVGDEGGHAPQTSPNAIELLPIGKVAPDPNNVRVELGDLTELTKSIGAKGVLQPLKVTATGGGWMVVYGHRRLAAAKAAGLKTVPCIVAKLDPAARLEEQIIENLHRSDLTPIEEAAAYKRLEELGLSQRTIVARVSRSQSHISKRLSLLGLPASTRAKLQAGDLSIGDALELTRLVGQPDAGQLIGAASSRARTHGSMRVAVDDTLRKSEEAATRRKTIDKLTADGVLIVEWRPYNYDRRYTPIGKGYNQIDITKERAKTDGTLAAAVRTDGTVEWVCTDRDRYKTADDRPGETAAARKDREERDAETAAAKAAHAGRIAAMRTVMERAGRMTFPRGDFLTVLRLLAVAVARHCDLYYGPELGEIAQLLGLDIAEEKDNEFVEAMDKYSAIGDRELINAAVASALVVCDPGESTSPYQWRTDEGVRCDKGVPKLDVALLFDTLEQLAEYTPAPFELEQLSRPTPAPGKSRARKAS